MFRFVKFISSVVLKSSLVYLMIPQIKRIKNATTMEMATIVAMAKFVVGYTGSTGGTVVETPIEIILTVPPRNRIGNDDDDDGPMRRLDAELRIVL